MKLVFFGVEKERMMHMKIINLEELPNVVPTCTL